MTTDDRDQYLAPSEVALRLRMSEATVRRAIRDGSLPAVQIHGARGSLRVPESALRPQPKEAKE
jgi:excisionase family DNA binding protein